jgi:hypothetical protein
MLSATEAAFSLFRTKYTGGIPDLFVMSCVLFAVAKVMLPEAVLTFNAHARNAATLSLATHV